MKSGLLVSDRIGIDDAAHDEANGRFGIFYNLPRSGAFVQQENGIAGPGAEFGIERERGLAPNLPGRDVQRLDQQKLAALQSRMLARRPNVANDPSYGHVSGPVPMNRAA